MSLTPGTRKEKRFARACPKRNFSLPAENLPPLIRLYEIVLKEMIMRKIVPLVFCFFLLFASVAHAELNIAVFNAQKVAAECDAFVEAKAAAEKQFGAQKDALDKQRDTIEKKAAALKGKATEKQQQELNKMHREYTEKAQAFVRVAQTAEMRIRRDIDTVILTAAKELAAKKGYNLILDTSSTAFADPKFDVTNDMLAEANDVWKKSKASAPAPEAGKDGDKDDKAPKTGK